MKVNLVVATGVHQGKVIPVAAVQFVIGRDPECQLRPASQAVSKQHCAILVREERVFVKDYGSTNGTYLNDEQLPANSERELYEGNRLRVGPLDFSVQLLAGATPSDSTPLPEALKAAGGSSGEGLKAAIGAGAKPVSSSTQKPVSSAATAPTPSPMPAAPKPKPASTADETDMAAAMLLGLDDEDPPKIPEGSTVFEMPAIDGATKPGEAKPGDKKKVLSQKDSSNAASDILRRYMHRPR